MKKSSVKFLTICLFLILVIGFVAYKSGLLFSEEKSVINDELTIDKTERITEDQLNVFQHLNSVGGFAPENFDTVYRLTPHYHEIERTKSDDFFLSSSKSAVSLVELSRYN